MTADHEHDEADQPPAYHLLVTDEELPVLRTALQLLVDDAAHEPGIRRPAGAVLAKLGAEGGGGGEARAIALRPGEMKVAHTALRLLLDDSQREQAEAIHVLKRLLEKLPDEHSMRAIELD